MQDNARHGGLMGLDIINPNAQTGAWLRLLAARGVIGADTVREGQAHFGLRRGRADWLLFLRRVFTLLGVLLCVSGLIFFMAWNWEDLGRFAKFAIVQSVFIALAAYSILRWGGGPAPRWDARVALAGAGFAIGGMLALYGQVYQTGADPWELFRAWTVLLALIAIPGRSTVFWFMVWISASLWLFLYLEVNFKWLFEDGELYLVPALAQFALLALNEAAALLLARRGIRHDRGRWLSRAMGGLAITLITSYAFYLAGEGNYGYYADRLSSLGNIIYLFMLGLCFVVYYRFIPDLLFLSLCIFSLAAFICLQIGHSLLDSFNDMTPFLLFGLIILGLAFGSMKLILLLRKNIMHREAPQGGGRGLSIPQLPGLFQRRAQSRAALKAWLAERGAVPQEAIEACFAEDEAAHQQESPWYAKVFVTIGVWIGSGITLGALTFLLFEGLQSPEPLGVLGLILCGVSVQTGHGKSLSARAFSQVLGIFGLLYSCLLFEFAKTPTAGLLAALFLGFWLLKPPFAARMGAFMAALVCLLLFIGIDGYAYSYSLEDRMTPIYCKTALYVLGLLWAAHYLVALDGRPPARLEAPRGEWMKKRLDLGEVFAASAYGALAVFAGIAIALSLSPVDLREVALDTRLGSVLVFAAAAALVAWRYPAACSLALPLGVPLAVLAWFAPYLAVGFGLLLLAFHCGSIALWGAAIPYLGFGLCIYYYNLDISLLHKSLVLMGSGLLLLIISRALIRPGRVPVKRGAQS